MSTDKYLKHLKSKDKFLIANASNYFEKQSGQYSSSYIQQTIQTTVNWGQQKNCFPSTERSTRNRYTFVAVTVETGTIPICGRF